MNAGSLRISGIIIVFLLSDMAAHAQISPGDLSKPHEFLEGITNCTKCHEIGNKITGGKCLDCHTEIKDGLSAGKGYHSSADIKGKQCIECHSDHHGKNFQLVRFNSEEFDHSKTGFSLSAPHSKLVCQECHNKKFITDQKIKNKQFTYLGIKEACLTCHTDYHLNTLSSSCLNCHGPETFKTAPAFNHANARFRLAGRHKSVQCIQCHKMETINGAKFQEFRGVAFSSCTNCHKDPHQNKFGQDCRRCHNEESFTTIKGMSNFDHNKTAFPLVDKHLTLDCKACHKTNLTDPLKHDRCTDCHADYHKGQFTKSGRAPDCSSCHSIKGFTTFSYTLEQHNQGAFPLKGAHVSQPCTECHKKQAEWSFRAIGTDCRDCHADIHKSFINTKFYPDENCRVCHNESTWKDISYDHSQTGFPLTGAHARSLCATCHISGRSAGTLVQRFEGLPVNCSACHNDIHQGQFNTNGAETCTDCHLTENWKPSKFDHNKTDFKLDGQHINVACTGCHKTQINGPVRYTLYKIKDFRCESCHF